MRAQVQVQLEESRARPDSPVSPCLLFLVRQSQTEHRDCCPEVFSEQSPNTVRGLDDTTAQLDGASKLMPCHGCTLLPILSCACSRTQVQ